MFWQRNSRVSWSAIVVVCLALVFLCTRYYRMMDKELSWDVLGYYMYLPATFIHDDPLLTDVSWLESRIKEDGLSDTLYFVSANKEGDAMYFFLMGMSIFYLPWFLLAHGMAYLFDYPPDGFSLPYIYVMIAGAVFYTVVGMIVLRKILKNYFGEFLTSTVLIIIYLGTNTIHHLIAKDLETVNVLFMLGAIVLWKTIQWHKNPSRARLLTIGVGIALMILVKPSEILIGLLPLLYGVYNRKTLLDKVKLIVTHRKDMLLTVGVGLLVLLPQMIYWQIMVGRPIYDSYNNPGVGLDWWNPHILEVLFSYKKGWLLYTPVMVLSLVGGYFLVKKNKELGLGAIVYLLISFFLISSWTEWWYGSSFSCRPIITLYPLLGLCIGYTLLWAKEKSKLLSIGMMIFVGWCVFLNQFQWWQLRKNILDDYSMTKEYYWRTFLKTYITQEDLDTKEVRPDFSGKGEVGDPEDYKVSVLWQADFLDPAEWIDTDKISKDSTGAFYEITVEDIWELSLRMPIEQFTKAEYFYADFEIVYRYPTKLPVDKFPYSVNAIARSNGAYGYHAQSLKASEVGEWNTMNYRYVFPRIREYSDRYDYCVWNPDDNTIDIKEVKVIIHEYLPEE